MNELNESLDLNIDFEKLSKIALLNKSVLPCVVQHAKTLEVLNVAYVNEEALKHSFKSGNATFWSTSRNEIWEKGATSGEYLSLEEVFINCEQNSLVYKVLPVKEATCHTGRKSCYYRKLESESLSWLKG
jgi:phosphoribosyl-AMP cyclohydrolase